VKRVADEAGDASADATVTLGRRLLRRLFASSRSAQIEASVVELAARPDDEASADVVRAQVRRALTEDADLAATLVRMLADAGAIGGDRSVTVTGSQGVQVGDHNTQTNTFGPPAR
jgi:hypothetical protein